MAEPITFYFEYASPYSYLAVQSIDGMATKHRREVLWRPIRLADVWTMIGRDNTDVPQAKMRYIREDAPRCAELQGVPIVEPEKFPPDATLARLAFYRLDSRDPALAQRFAQGVSNRYYG